MKKIGLLSDTHGYWDDRYLKYFEPCDEIWHAGDIGSAELALRLAAFRPLRAVYGNIDGAELRRLYPQTLRFTIEGAEVVMKHIGGYPGHFSFRVQRTAFRVTYACHTYYKHVTEEREAKKDRGCTPPLLRLEC